MAEILDGKLVSQKIAKKLTQEAKELGAPTLAIIQVGDKKESSAYIERKVSFGKQVGAEVRRITLPEEATQKEIIAEIRDLNLDFSVHGIIVQLPLPKHIDRFAVIEEIDPRKDVDGLHSRNAGLLYESAFGGTDPRTVPAGLIPATARGIITLLKHYKVALSGKKVVVIGRSLLVGKPVAMLLLKENATVTIAHSKTEDLEKLTKTADVVIVSVGKAKFFDKKYFSKNQVVVDVGTNAEKGKKELEENPKIKLVGDVDFVTVSKVVSKISPVPGGVGPMTVASLFENLFKAYKDQKSGRM